MPEWQSNKGPAISYREMNRIKKLLDSKSSGRSEIEVSLDLNISKSKITVDHENYEIILPSDSFEFPQNYNPDTDVCYIIRDGDVFPLQYFDDDTNFFYKLVPTSWRPILRISATPMHKKPFLDFLERVRPTGWILDAGTGLGYSAIIASQSANKVITVEWDKNVLNIATHNPHSYELFDSDNIDLVHADVTKHIKQYENEFFDNIIHDGGMPKSSGNFFSQNHAHQLYRKLKYGGSVYFYLPKKGKNKGRDFAGEQIDRMTNAGFMVIERNDEGSYTYFGKE